MKLSKDHVEKLVESVVFGMIIPYAEDYVKGTPEKWDDATLAMLKDFLQDVVNHISTQDGD